MFLLAFAALAATPLFRTVGNWGRDHLEKNPLWRGLLYGLIPAAD